jgi:16S rRNA (uracil1498-N3)-methyltransferase
MARVSEIGSSSVFADLIAENKTDGELPDITLYMALLKGGNFEFVLQKAVEVGVNRIIPVISSRTVPDPAKKISEKHSRWVRIISGAAKQSMRSGMPEMGYPLSFSDAVKNCSSPVKLIAHPGADTGLRVYLSSMEKPESVSLLVGPEGGFSEQEIELASGSGWEPVNFGSTHLRAETAAVILPSLIIYQWG